MPQMLEINRIEELAGFGPDWRTLLERTAGGSFFQSLPWLEAYWSHFGSGQRLRVLIELEAGRATGILPLVVRWEKTRLGRFRVLTYPLHGWGSFYGPIGPEPAGVLRAGLEHVSRGRRDWDILDLPWQGAVGAEPLDVRAVMASIGFRPYPTVWDRTAIVDIDGDWDSYWSSRDGAWLRKYRSAERKLNEQGKLTYVRYRPAGGKHGDGSPRWDLYDACEQLARHSWQAAATDGTTLSDEPVRGFLREVHEAAAEAGAVDLNLLMMDDSPVAFIYGYRWRGYVYGLRRGYDARLTRGGAGNVLLGYTLRDSFAQGDRFYDMGVGSLESKRHFHTRLVPIMRYSHFSSPDPRVQMLRLRRWRQSKRAARQ
ncbi:MAG: GNAT family N-acetyltransferase [Pirellulales bacterium]|nr:GNAT family N-acetyltransferase [Pirellulales bacterium]